MEPIEDIGDDAQIYLLGEFYNYDMSSDGIYEISPAIILEDINDIGFSPIRDINELSAHYVLFDDEGSEFITKDLVIR